MLNWKGTKLKTELISVHSLAYLKVVLNVWTRRQKVWHD
jgi:hypothetical protein